MRKILGALILATLIPLLANAAPYGPEGKAANYRQPDGSTVKVRVFGDEFYAVSETEEGYTVVYDEDKVLRYGKLSADRKTIVPSGVRANNKPEEVSLGLLGIKKHIRLNQGDRTKAVAKGLQRMRADRKGRITPQSVQYYETALAAAAAGKQSSPSSEIVLSPPPSYSPPSETRVGEYIGLCILVEFSDQAGTIPRSDVDDYCNKPGYTGDNNACSIYDYFQIQSSGRLFYNNIVTAYVQVPNPKTFYDDGVDGVWGNSRAQDLVSDALDVLIAQGFDFTQLSRDSGGTIYSVNLFYAGTCASGWSTGLWPHKWAIPTKTVDAANGIKAYTYQMSDMGSELDMGTFCHENGHMLMGYPDLYSYNGCANNMGNFTLMAGGSHTGGGKHPCNVDPYLKTASGWSDVIDLDNSSHQRCTLEVDANLFYRYLNPTNADEYFLFEVRDNTGYEGNYGGSATVVSPANGLVVYHVLEDGSSTHSTIFTTNNPNPMYSTPYETMIVEANPSTSYTPWYDDPTPGSNDAYKDSDKNQISDATTPALKFWHAAGRTTASGCEIHSISADGPVMTFVIGAGAPGGSPSIVLTTTNIDISCDAGTTVDSQTFSICNGGGGTLAYAISTNAAWLSCSPSSGTAGSESDTITINYATGGLPASSYSATITVTDPSASPTTATIKVNLTVNPQPILGISPALISTNAYSGSSGAQVAVSIENTGGGTMTYSVSSTQTWATLTPSSGTVVGETDTVYVDLDASALGSGVYYDTITITSPEASNSPQTIPVTFTVFVGPDAGISPTNLFMTAVTGAMDSASVIITNSGGSDLTVSITDDLPAEGYNWLTSDDAGGPTYSWIDISALGSAVALADDGESSMLSVGFDFPFYGSTYNQFQIGDNGVVSLTAGQVGYTHAALPATGIPSQSFALFWDDMNCSASGEVRYHSTAERLVVSWLASPHYGGSNPETFQLVLYPDGRILYQYKTVSLGTGCSVGLQDNSGSGPAIQMALNETFLKNSFAIEVTTSDPPWLSYSPTDTVVSQDTGTSVGFYASASNLTAGVYTSIVSIAMNDADTPLLDVPVVFTVTDVSVPQIEVSSPSLSVPEGGNNTFDVRLSETPGGPVTVNVSRSAGSTDLTVTGGSTLNFTTGNGTNWQTVTIAAANDEPDWVNDNATILCEDAGATFASNTVAVQSLDDDPDMSAMQIIASSPSITIAEGGSNTFNLALSELPSISVTVNVSRASGDTDLTVADGATLIFTAGNGTNWQQVTIAAASDEPDWDNDNAIFQCVDAAAVVQSTNVSAEALDDDPNLNYQLPFSETFDGAGMASTAGPLSGQHGWTGGANALVTAGVGRSGSQALSMAEDTAEHSFSNGSDNVTISMWYKPVFGEDPTSVDADATAVFWVNTNGYVRAYSNTTAVTLPLQVSTGVWAEFEVAVDYSAGYWQLSVDGTPGGSQLGLYSAQTNFTSIKIDNVAVNPVILDDINISPSFIDLDLDGMDDTWETDNSVDDPNGDADLDGATNYEEFIMGTDPNDDTMYLRIVTIGSDTDGKPIITWHSDQDGSTPQRRYKIQRRDSLTSGNWSDVMNNVAPDGATTVRKDTTITSSNGVYRVIVY